MKFVLILVFIFSMKVHGQDVDVDVDHVGIARLMLKNNYPSRAKSSLNNVNLKEDDVNLGDYYFLWGMVFLHEKDFAKSLENFNLAIESGISNTEIYIYLSEAYFQIGKYDEALGALERVSLSHQERLAYWILKSRSLWKKQQKDQAVEVLNQGIQKNISASMLLKQKFSFFIEDQIYFGAFELVQKYWKVWAESDVLAFAHSFRQVQQINLAVQVLERGHLDFSNSSAMALELAQSYISDGNKWSAAIFLENKSSQLSELSHEASLLLRDVGLIRRSEIANLRVVDDTKNVRNRLALYLEGENYSHVSRLEPLLNKLGVLQDDEVRYALAYSQFKTGDFSKSESHLNRLAGDSYFRKSIELKKIMSDCRKTKWSCSETL